jgi:hypothetical protein
MAHNAELFLLGEEPQIPEWYEQLHGAQQGGWPPWVQDGWPWSCPDPPTVAFWGRCAIVKERAESEARAYIQDNPGLFKKSEIFGQGEGLGQAHHANEGIFS